MGRQKMHRQKIDGQMHRPRKDRPTVRQKMDRQKIDGQIDCLFVYLLTDKR